MKRALMTLVLLAACGGSSDPLVGSWKHPSLNEVYTFNSDKTLSIVVMDMGAGAGCMHTEKISGTYAETTASTLTITTASATTQISGCTDASMNVAEKADPGASLGTNTFGFVVNGSSLNITNAQGQTTIFSKQ